MKNVTEDTLIDLKMRMAMDQNLLFFTSVLYGLELKLGDTPYNTACTDGVSIIFTKEFLEGMSEDEALGLLLHEVRHVTDMHQFRLAGRDPKLWNAACDYAINYDIINDGFKLPQLEHACYDKKYANMAAEEIYEDLLKDSPEAQPMISDLKESTSEDDSPEKEIDAEIETEIKDLIIQASQITERVSESAASKIPSHIKRMVEEWLNPVVPWQNILQKYMNQKCKDDYSWQRPNRRYAAHKLYVPSLYSEQLGNIHVFIDGSCSVSTEMFNMQVGQINWIKNNLNPRELRIIVFNTKIVDEFIFDDCTPIKVEFKARGGTAVTEVVTYMEENKAECNIVMTDGYFRHISLKNVKDDVLALIYDNNNFEWEGATTIYLPAEKLR
jgi:predicted metal-dependent peptidase